MISTKDTDVNKSLKLGSRKCSATPVRTRKENQASVGCTYSFIGYFGLEEMERQRKSLPTMNSLDFPYHLCHRIAGGQIGSQAEPKEKEHKF